MFNLRPFLLFLFLTSAIGLLGCSHTQNLSKTKQADVILEVSPIGVSSLSGSSSVDVLGQDPQSFDEKAAVVQFKIEQVKKGEFTKVKTGGPSKFEQAKQAAKDGRVLKLLTLDFDNPEDVSEKPWVTVAVANPFESFEILNWDNPGSRKYRLYLKREETRADSYRLLQAEKIPTQTA